MFFVFHPQIFVFKQLASVIIQFCLLRVWYNFLHLLKYDTVMSFIQRLLGHNDINITMRYAKIGNTGLLMALNYPEYVDRLVTCGAVLFSSAGMLFIDFR